MAEDGTPRPDMDAAMARLEDAIESEETRDICLRDLENHEVLTLLVWAEWTLSNMEDEEDATVREVARTVLGAGEEQAPELYEVHESVGEAFEREVESQMRKYQPRGVVDTLRGIASNPLVDGPVFARYTFLDSVWAFAVFLIVLQAAVAVGNLLTSATAPLPAMGVPTWFYVAVAAGSAVLLAFSAGGVFGAKARLQTERELGDDAGE